LAKGIVTRNAAIPVPVFKGYLWRILSIKEIRYLSKYSINISGDSILVSGCLYFLGVMNEK
jgi:hypothetical protein